MRLLMVATVLAGLGGEALAQDCPRPAGWAKPARHVAARDPQMRFALKAGTSAQLQLHAEPLVKLAKAQREKPDAKQYAGLAALDVTKAGTLDMVLSDRAYVDLVRDGKALDSSAHRHGKCAGIAKVVSFDVKPGRYIVQLVDSPARAIKMATIAR